MMMIMIIIIIIIFDTFDLFFFMYFISCGKSSRIPVILANHQPDVSYDAFYHLLHLFNILYI